MACSRKSGEVSMSTVRPSYCTMIEGRSTAVVRIARGADAAVVHPMVGTPIEVPLPSTVRVAFISSRCGIPSLRRVGEHVGHFEIGHAQFVEHVPQRAFFRGGEVALGLVLQDAEDVDGLARAHQVHLGFSPCGAARPSCISVRHVERGDELLEAHLEVTRAGRLPCLTSSL